MAKTQQLPDYTRLKQLSASVPPFSFLLGWIRPSYQARFLVSKKKRSHHRGPQQHPSVHRINCLYADVMASQPTPP